ncbi:16S rRNA (uracil(1498)-N(3))-methyltransferase [Mesorhizobium sp. BR1-1-16]|uniref:16S rRNA (uracil(1498)-N(3))-methyltransferase n=1 Tax=Mesorhizobium sp. BR1-1-16 TaxID=2876653 RepID=UPI001CCF0D68|nr:16S rRNA (uracil(1498)-N(3))-methyltransferase [Mesorhizobium sp. BR1-1-16]MBZ9936128.1 16S rRNA (uracil(1498)-N(3))-methyltransferase [Mesorhizobium sp. BR1-1-16]
MSRYDFASQRLFLDAPLDAGARVPLDRDQANYLVNVLRMAPGAAVLVFNGRDGEWRAVLDGDRKRASLVLEEQTRAQTAPSGLDYLFAPLKQARLDYMVQKAVEMGAGRLRPVITRRTQVTRLNEDRLRANAIEAAEQCGILTIPDIVTPQPLADLLTSWETTDAGRRIIFCDEDETGADPVSVLGALPPSPLAVLIGPEGGFSPEERTLLKALPLVTTIALGPRILRADTAAVAALALVQAVAGDWREA